MAKATKTLKEMQDTLEEEKREMQVVLWLVIFVVIGLVGVGLFATWQYCRKGGASEDLEAHQKPSDSVEKKWSDVSKSCPNFLLFANLHVKSMMLQIRNKYYSEESSQPNWQFLG